MKSLREKVGSSNEIKKEVLYLAKKKDEISIRSGAAEYLTHVASAGNQQDGVEVCHEKIYV